MSADQAPAADPTPGSSRVDVAGLRAAAEAIPSNERSWHQGWEQEGEILPDGSGDVGGWTSASEVWLDNSESDEVRGFETHSRTVAAFIAAADPTTVLALLDRLATAEAEVERLRDPRRVGSMVWDEVLATVGEDLLASLKERAEVAERQVQAVQKLAWDVIRANDDSVSFEPCIECLRSGVALLEGASYDRMDKAVEDLRAALAPLDPDAPTGRDGQGDPDTHQGDTEAGERCSVTGLRSCPWHPDGGNHPEAGGR